MATFVKGAVVIPFPFSDLTATKRRPALIVAALAGPDVILCPITSQAARNADAVAVTTSDFQAGGLQQTSNVRPDHLFTAEESLILYRVGKLSAAKVAEVTGVIISILTR